MKKAEAIKAAHDAGYTIHFKSYNDVEHHYRKPGVAMNAINEPDMYAVVKKSGRSWTMTERVATSW